MKTITEYLIDDAIDCWSSTEQITNKTLADAAGVSISTIKRYWKIKKDLLNSAKV